MMVAVEASFSRPTARDSVRDMALFYEHRPVSFAIQARGSVIVITKPVAVIALKFQRTVVSSIGAFFVVATHF